MNIQLTVEEAYEALSEGEAEHMANKLSKHGYPKRGVHSRGAIVRQALEGNEEFDIGDMSLKDIVAGLKEHNVTLDDILKRWYQ